MSRRTVGIDLGTGNSVVATVDGGGTVTILRNAVGTEITPSTVVGEEAAAKRDLSARVSRPLIVRNRSDTASGSTS
jgi:molecular chaperone DnaK (HSP70)